MSPLHRSLLPFLALLATPLAAQNVASERTYLFNWPLGQESSTFDRALSGQFGTNSLPDAAVLRKLGGVGTAYYMMDPQRFDYVHAFASGARDIALLPGGAVDGRDGVLALTNLGLELFTVSGSSGLMVSQGSKAEGPWTTASRIWSVEDAAGTWWTYALDAGAATIRYGSWSLVPVPTFTEAPTTFNAPIGLQELAAMDYDGSGPEELVTWTGQFVFISTFAGSPIAWLDLGSTSASPPIKRAFAISRGSSYPSSGAERDLICIYYENVVTESYQLLSFNGLFFGGFLDLGSIPGHLLSSGDFSGDGFGDLFLSSATDSRAHYLRRTNGWPAFELPAASTIQFVAGGISSPPSKIMGLTTSQDFDGDGDLDLLAFQAENKVVHTFLSHRKNGCTIGIAPNASTISEPSATQSMIVSVTLPANLLNMSPKPTHVRLEGWFHPTGFAFPFNPVRSFVHDFDISSLTPNVANPLTISWNPEGLAENFVLQLHGGVVELSGSTVTTRFPTNVVYVSKSMSEISALRSRYIYETASFPPHDGGGSVSGNTGHSRPPGSPPSP